MIDIEKIKKEAETDIGKASDMQFLDSVRVKYLGRSGSITLALREIGSLSPDKRAETGKLLNQLKNSISEKIDSKKEIIEKNYIKNKIEKEKIDVTLPGRIPETGKLHIITTLMEEIKDIFRNLGFKVEYGPVRADDLPEYLQTRQATPEMRRVRFPLTDRLFLAPVELVHYLPHMLITALIFFFVDGFRSSVGAIVAILAGTVMFPIFLPWLPTRDFSTKGIILGGLVMFPFAWVRYMETSDTILWIRVGQALIYLLALPPITAYLSLNFTGSSTFTSQTGVKREIYLWVPIMVALVGIGFVLTIIFKFV